MDALPYDVRAAEAKTQVRDASRDLAPRTDLLDGLARFNKIDAVRVVLLDACVDTCMLRVPYCIYIYIYDEMPRARRAPAPSYEVIL